LGCSHWFFSAAFVAKPPLQPHSKRRSYAAPFLFRETWKSLSHFKTAAKLRSNLTQVWGEEQEEQQD
jgi:hypothetical protein